jgi:hypothetical protein
MGALPSSCPSQCWGGGFKHLHLHLLLHLHHVVFAKDAILQILTLVQMLMQKPATEKSHQPECTQTSVESDLFVLF